MAGLKEKVRLDKLDQKRAADALRQEIKELEDKLEANEEKKVKVSFEDVHFTLL